MPIGVGGLDVQSQARSRPPELSRARLLLRFAAIVAFAAFALVGLLGVSCTDQHAAAEERGTRRPRELPEGLYVPRTPAPPTIVARPPDAGRAATVPAKVIAVGVNPAAGLEMSGTLRLVEAPGGVHLQLELRHAPPGHYAIVFDGASDCFGPPTDSTSSEAAEARAGTSFEAGRIDVNVEGESEASVFLSGADLEDSPDAESLIGRCVELRDASPGAKPGARIGTATVTRVPD